MQLLKKYNDNFSLDVDRPKGKILLAFQACADKSKRNNFVDNLFHAEKYSLTNDTFKITRKQAFFDPFRGIGQINIRLLSINEDDKTKLVFETTPFKNDDKYDFLFLLFFLVVWTIASFFISTNFYTIIIVLLGWAVIPLILHFWLKLNKTKLRNYSYSFIQKLFD
ncbi:hypothetical protein QTN47_25525 [Danxiaibacter flavus]|uniref:Uncharacterized protein n=1 Tax=Danxiaibacter flavus TaxID=3049108 RepID=A0ABV3ZMZ2_9BACT|nr:hypothetical protein QNM32_25530 [Chitinophagaceae bacterium DXS]